jgi:hypothetical protein
MSTIFTIKSGLQDFFRPYQATILPTTSTITRLTLYKGSWVVWADYEITISAKNLSRDNVDLQLGNAEREIMKEICQYRPGDIDGILEMQYMGMERIYDSSNWSRSTWSSKTFIRIRYHRSSF